MRKIIIGLGVLILIFTSIVSWVVTITLLLVLFTLASRVKMLESTKWLVTFPKVFYVATIKHLVLLLLTVIILAPIYVLITGVGLSPFYICIYIMVLICAVAGLDFCVRISKAAVCAPNGLKLSSGKAKANAEYTKLVLTKGEKHRKGIIYIPREEKRRKTCMVYVDFKDKSLDRDDLSTLIKSTSIYSGIGYSMFTFENSEDGSKENNVFNFIEHIKCLKEDINFEKVIVVAAGATVEESMDLWTEEEYKKIDGLIALYPNIDIIKAAERNLNIFAIYGSHSDIINVNNIKRSGNYISYLELPWSGECYDNFFIRKSIVASKVNKEISNWISTNF